jgi:membrane protein DedA with SNARE-associated domain
MWRWILTALAGLALVLNAGSPTAAALAGFALGTWALYALGRLTRRVRPRSWLHPNNTEYSQREYMEQQRRMWGG